MKKIVALLLASFLLLSAPCYAGSVSAWMSENGYSFPFYGKTDADLTPISDYLSLLEDNGIYITIPEMSVTARDDYDWIYSQISESGMYLTFIAYTDTSAYDLRMEIPDSYKPQHDALVLLMVSALGVSKDDAEDLLSSLEYNTIDGMCNIEKDGYALSYAETFGIRSLTVSKEQA